MSEIIQLTDTARLRIETDTDARNPREDMDMSTGFAKVRGRGDSRRIDVVALHRWHSLEDAIERLLEIEEQVPRWARAFHGKHVEYDPEHGGFWFVDEDAYWGEMTPDQGRKPLSLEEQEKVITGDRQTYEAWAESEVYGVILERGIVVERKVTHADGSVTYDRDDEQWEEIESIWGCYLDDEYTAQHVALEHWELSDEEQAALGLDAPVG